MSLVKRFLNWMAPDSYERIEAEEENDAFDKLKVDEAFMEMLKAARQVKRSSSAFIVAAELLIKDVRGSEKAHAKASARTKKSS